MKVLVTIYPLHWVLTPYWEKNYAETRYYFLCFEVLVRRSGT